MSQAWRQKRYYRPRVLLHQDAVLSPTENEILVCLDGAELAILRTLLAYGTRRITWVAEYRQEDYLTPTDEDFDTILAKVADLEEKLMSGTCEDLVTALEAIGASVALTNDWLETIDGTLGDGLANLPDVVTALECICGRIETAQINVTVSPTWVDAPDATDYMDWSTTAPDTSVGPQADQDACDLAQAWYQCGFEFSTEVLLPVLRFGFDKVIPAAAAALSFWTGGVAVPVAIGVYALAELIQELLELGYDAAEANLQNWLFVHKEDIVCLLYSGLKNGGSGQALWSTVQSSLVAPAGDLSAGDKFLISFAFGTVGLLGAKVAKEQNSAWYQSVPEAGYCDSCEDPPVVGDDWIAMPIAEGDGDLVLNKTSGGTNIKVCWNASIPAGYQMCGLILNVTAAPPSLGVKAVDGAQAGGCPGDQWYAWDMTHVGYTTGYMYFYVDGTHDDAAVIAQLCVPYKGEWFATLALQDGPKNVGTCYLTYWGETGLWTATVTHIVFKGTTPPPAPYY